MHQLRVFGSFWFANGSFSILFKGHPLSCQWQEVEGLLFNPSEPHGRRYVKNMGHNRTVFIQGPSIVLQVWRSIMFNGSFLKVCRILRLCPIFLTYLLPRGSESRAIVDKDTATLPVVWSQSFTVQENNISVFHTNIEYVLLYQMYLGTTALDNDNNSSTSIPLKMKLGSSNETVFKSSNR